jgi:hypothetical protein
MAGRWRSAASPRPAPGQTVKLCNGLAFVTSLPLMMMGRVRFTRVTPVGSRGIGDALGAAEADHDMVRESFAQSTKPRNPTTPRSSHVAHTHVDDRALVRRVR